MRETELMQAAVREGVAEIAEAMGFIKRQHKAGSTSKSPRPKGMVGVELERAIGAIALRYPDRVEVRS